MRVFIFILFLISTRICSYSQEYKIYNDSISIVEFSNPLIGIKSVKFSVYKSFDLISKLIKKELKNDSDCRITLYFEVNKTGKIEICKYNSNCKFIMNTDILSFLKENINLNLLNFEIDKDKVDFSIPIYLRYTSSSSCSNEND